MSQQAVQNFYGTTGMERNRLQVNTFQLEGVRTQEIIQRYLTRSKMVVADIGGATGAYAFWLHDMGHNVHLLDVTPLHIEEAKNIAREEGKPLASIELADARHLPYEDNMFDIALLLGPLYHLQSKEDRLQCLREAFRVLKNGGTLLAAAITRYASLFDGFWQKYVDDPAFEAILKQDLEDGQHQNPTDNLMYFTTAHFHAQAELDEECRIAGFNQPAVIAIEGFGWLIPDFNIRWDDENYRKLLLSYVAKTERDPAMIGISAHMMAIGKKE